VFSYTQTPHVHHEKPRELTPVEVEDEYRRSVIRGRIYWMLIFMAVACYVWSIVGGL
jgi:hypothetical protein